MWLRIWRTAVDAKRFKEFERFEQEFSKPMFQRISGCLGVFFVRVGESSTAVVTLWRDRESISALGTSSLYKETAAKLIATGLLRGEQSVEVMAVADFWLVQSVFGQAPTDDSGTN